MATLRNQPGHSLTRKSGGKNSTTASSTSDLNSLSFNDISVQPEPPESLTTPGSFLSDDHDVVSSDQKQSVTLEALMATMLSEFASLKTEFAFLKTQQAATSDRLEILENSALVTSTAIATVESAQKEIETAVLDFQERIPHNIASGLVAATADINHTMQCHIANEVKTTRDLAERVTIIETSPQDVASSRLLYSVNATMDKVATTLTTINRTTEAQYLSLRNMTELAFHRVTAPIDDSILTMLLSWQSYKKYKHGGGSLTFLENVDRSPDVRELYLEKARKETYPSFDFTRDDDTVFFTELIQHVFYPDGITVAIFNNIVATHKMSEFSIQSASTYKIWIFFLVRVLHDHLPDSLTPQLWEKVAKNAFPPGFQYSLLSHPPRTLKDFPKTIETRAAVFRDRKPSNGLRQQSVTPNYIAVSDRSPPVDASRLMHTTSPMPGFRDRGRTVNNISTRDACSHCRTSEHSTPDCPLLRDDHSEDSEDD